MRGRQEAKKKRKKKEKERKREGEEDKEEEDMLAASVPLNRWQGKAVEGLLGSGAHAFGGRGGIPGK